MKPVVECVPNFSEGRDPAIIEKIAQRMNSVPGAAVLHVDPGKATNRTVMTLAGEPEAVLEAAFRGIAAAAELIDMSRHHGEHPRMGATDVCPFVPIRGITMVDAAALARQLGERVGKELGIPVYLYEAAQPDEARRRLPDIREGEYEGLERKLADPKWKPDFGPAKFNAKSGATVIGARDFLVAYNVNLNTTSTRRANAVAFDVREAGRPQREGGSLTGKVLTDARGEPLTLPGTLKAVKGIGWFIDEYGVAQVSMNLTGLSVTPIHVAFDEVERAARDRGMRATGSEIVGLVPLQAMLDAGRHYLRRQQRSLGVSDRELIHIAIRSLGLDELAPFVPEERIIEYRLRDPGDRRLVTMPLEDFVIETASESPAPGGGSVSAAVGAMAASLATMVANLSSHKRGWDERWEEFSTWAERGQAIQAELLRLVDADTKAFDAVLAAMQMPKETQAEKDARRSTLDAAIVNAARIPFAVMQQSIKVFDIAQAMAETGLPASVSDAGVAACCARTAVRGAWLNVRINAGTLKDRALVQPMLDEGARLVAEADRREGEVLGIVDGKMGR
ncbi:MAG TPA: glutamate formimidoyltransferase [Gemmatimonadales bacterium]|nr:glutamate formimidoyltransferase [Gemmatimonadales bacterium]